MIQPNGSMINLKRVSKQSLKWNRKPVQAALPVQLPLRLERLVEHPRARYTALRLVKRRSQWRRGLKRGICERLLSLTLGEVSALSFSSQELRLIIHHSWSTYRALLYWMYTHRLRLIEPHSNYLVHLDSLNSVIKASLDDKKDMANTAERTDDRPSRRAWLLKRAEKAAIYSPDKQEVQPASPHAIYRLANKLDMRDLQELAKCAITDQFTVENVGYFLLIVLQLETERIPLPVQVLYELVSTFSHQFDEVRESAHEFALEHWVRLLPSSSTGSD